MKLFAALKQNEYKVNARPYLRNLGVISDTAVDELIKELDNGGLALEVDRRQEVVDAAADRKSLVQKLAREGFLEIKSNYGTPAMVLRPVGPSFVLDPVLEVGAAAWKMSRFAYLNCDEGVMVGRNPLAHCELVFHDPALIQLVSQFSAGIEKDKVKFPDPLKEQVEVIFRLLVQARIIEPMNDEGKIPEEIDPLLMPWDFHDLLFHAQSRTGRNGKPVGGTYRFKGVIPQEPAIKENPWADSFIPLPRPDLTSLYFYDMPLTAALESRRSVRSHSPVPLSIQQLGELLFRAVRIRHKYDNEFGTFTSRPYPNGGALYEQEFYLTVENCAGLQRGIYYYDALHHGVCLVSTPNEDTKGMLDDAHMATAMTCRPQILITIASRFNRFHWKYSSMSYAAQLKNVGVIYQTLWLVATAMNIGACGLGIGNPDRLCRLTGENYLREGSIGELMLGRPL